MGKAVFRKWHRRLGLVSFVVVIWLALSGILINHGDRLEFNQQEIKSDFINSLYGIKRNIPQALLFNERYIYCAAGYLYVDNEQIASCDADVLQLVEYQGQAFVLEKQSLFILSQDALLIDQIMFSLIGKYPELMSVENDMLILQGNIEERLQQWRLNLETLDLEETSGYQFQEQLSEKLPLPEKLLEALPRDGVSIERILLDAHSGRLFGNLGVYVMDAFAIFFVFISLSGFYLFIKQKR